MYLYELFSLGNMPVLSAVRFNTGNGGVQTVKKLRLLLPGKGQQKQQ